LLLFGNLRMSPPPSSLGGLSPSPAFGLFFGVSPAAFDSRSQIPL
jgi:hypothetical protein